MNIHRATTSAAAALLSLTLLTACSSSSAGAAADSSSATTAPTQLALDRKNVAAVAAAFAADYASGNTPAACGFAVDPALSRMQSEGLCKAPTAWNETPRQIRECSDAQGRPLYSYQVDKEIDRFLIFTVRMTEVNGVWAVDSLGKSSPGEGLSPCAVQTSSSTGDG